ncbi:MAG: thiamine pyrophosphate-dependent enzyme, partial [bacterium]
AEELNALYRADVSVVSQSGNFLEAMTQQDATTHNRNELIEGLHREYLSFVTAPRAPQSGVSMDQVMTFLRQRLPADTIITNGAGNYTTWPQRHYQFSIAKTQLASTNGSMGYGVPAAVSAQLTRPESVVVSFSGDGCFLMNGQELATAVQYQLPILFLVINNRSYGTIRSHQERHYPGRVVGTDLTNPDFAALGRAYGAIGFTVNQTEEFEPVFEQAIASKRPTVIEIQTF